MTGAGPELRAVLRTMPAGALVLALPRAASPAARRVALSLIEEAAAFGGGQLRRQPTAELLLGASPVAAARAADAVQDLLGLAAPRFRLPDEQPALEAWLAAQPPPAPAEAGIAALEARCAAVPVEALARVTFFADGAEDRAVAQRLAPAPFPVEEPELAEQARDWLCRRLLATLTDPAQLVRLPALRPGLRLLLDLPCGAMAGGGVMRAGGGGVAPLALLPMAAMAEPGFTARAAQLRGAGWEVALHTTDPGLAAGWAGAVRLAAPPPEAPPLPAGFIALGPAIPAWCRVPGVLRELPA
ncbi:MAG: hypothetical protein MUF65_09615 [Rubritepida sp.]|nr:hypothetical protein [Rubritepida sp.]MCU0945614.1 hypothetical protein [Rubritepida sp.]